LINNLIITLGVGNANLLPTLGFGYSYEIPTGLCYKNSLSVNIKKSIDSYVRDNLMVNNDFAIDFEGVPFNNVKVQEWLTPRIISMPRKYHRQGSEDKYAQTNNINLNIDTHVKVSGATTSDRHYVLRDDTINYFRIGTDIPLRDYTGSGSTLVCYMRVRKINEDRPLFDDPLLLKYRVGFELDFTEMVTEA